MKGFLIFVTFCISGIIAWAPPRQDVPGIETLVPECRADQIKWLWPDFKDAAKYYTCAGVGWAVSMFCPGGTKFMYEYQHCLHAHDWVSPRPPTESPPSTTKPPRVLPKIETLVPECRMDQLEWLWPNFKDATRFYQCGGPGWLHSMPCAPGTKFVFEKQECLHPYEWVSPQPPTQSTVSSTESTTIPSLNPSIPASRPTVRPSLSTTPSTEIPSPSSDPSIPTISTPAPTPSTPVSTPPPVVTTTTSVESTTSTPVPTPSTPAPTPSTPAPTPSTPAPTSSTTTTLSTTSTPDGDGLIDLTSRFPPIPPTPSPTTSTPEADGDLSSSVRPTPPTPPTASPTSPNESLDPIPPFPPTPPTLRPTISTAASTAAPLT